ncbi:MAG: tryptophan synthase subunit alpha [Phycisphaeraceae bacterium]|nr:tryptophan synthase subunit alpha [Phycisphaeraceae bacterium]MBX3406268.1 tryptophan synthase subunit alpha [Phycisphaeraceae bacterium]
MSRIDSIFRDLRASGRKALMPFLCGGYPRPGVVADALIELQSAGANIVEIGIPFSDPIADGPVIAAAMHEAIAAGCTPESVTEEVRRARAAGCDIGIVAMVSVSIVWRLGPEPFFRRLADAGFDGVILPDLTAEESGPWRTAAAAAGLTTTLLVAPTTSPLRATEIARACTGFVYVLTRSGITGEGGEVAAGRVAERVAMLRRVTELPLACGFGIGTPEQVRQVVQDGGADAAIVGSALVKRMGAAARAGQSPAREAGEFCRELGTGLGHASSRG